MKPLMSRIILRKNEQVEEKEREIAVRGEEERKNRMSSNY